MTTLITKHQKAIQDICRQEGISYLALFGSHARRDQKTNSDVDLLVTYKEPVDFVELYDTEEKFKKLFRKDVDLVTTSGLSKYIKPYIQDDLTVLYEEKP